MCMLYHPDKHQDPGKKKVRLKVQALFALSKLLFVFLNNLSTGSHFQSERFFSPAKFSQLSPEFKDAVEKIWRPTIFCRATNSFVPFGATVVEPFARPSVGFILVGTVLGKALGSLDQMKGRVGGYQNMIFEGILYDYLRFSLHSD